MTTAKLRATRAALLAASALAIAAPTASAATFCVHTASCDGGTSYNTGTSEAQMRADLQNALNAAAAGTGSDDQVLVGDGTFVGMFVYNDADRVDIVGSGAGTVISPPAGGYGFAFESAASSISNLTFKLDPPGGGAGGTAVDFADGVIHDVTFSAATGINGTGVLFESGTPLLHHSVVALGSSSKGVSASSGTPTVRDTTFTGNGTGVEAATNVTLERLRFDGNVAALRTYAGATTVRDSLVVVGANQTGIKVSDDNASAAGSAALYGDGLTVVENPSTSTFNNGVWVAANSDGDAMSVDLTNTVVDPSLFAPLRCHEGNDVPDVNAGNASLLINYSSHPFRSIGDGWIGGGCDYGSFNSTNAAPAFVDAANGDYTPAFPGPLIDGGNPATTGAGRFDVTGDTRVIDGDGGGARIDIGAFEAQQSAPVASATATPTSATTGQPIGFSATATDDDGGALTYAWSFSDGGSASGASVPHAFATAGTHSGTVTVTDPTGRTGTATATVTITAPAGGDQGGNSNTNQNQTQTNTTNNTADNGTSTTDTVKPLLTGLALSSRRFRLGTGAPRAAASGGTVISYSLTEAGTATLAFERKLRGRRKGSKCLTGRKAPKRGKRCTTYAKAKTMTWASVAGANRIRFFGRLRNKKALAPGSYRVTITSKDAAGNSSTPVRATFTLLPPRKR